jgi:hypothetical protein
MLILLIWDLITFFGLTKLDIKEFLLKYILISLQLDADFLQLRMMKRLPPLKHVDSHHYELQLWICLKLKHNPRQMQHSIVYTYHQTLQQRHRNLL